MGRLIKRAADVLLAALGLVVLLPLLLVVSLLVLVRLGTPVLFRQERSGLRGRPFRLLKFRTMTDERGPDGALLPDEQRLTRTGILLRRTSVDELPQLWHVLTGHMSLVGPRPLHSEYLQRYTAHQARRHEMRPGMTGWTQCSFRGKERTWEEKFDADVWYIDHWSLWLDIQILLATFGAVVRRGKLTDDGKTSAERFTGSSSLPPEGCNGGESGEDAG